MGDKSPKAINRKNKQQQTKQEKRKKKKHELAHASASSIIGSRGK
ncbi:hypothetical protein [Pelagicoccus sp. SDUM812005]|nr:hypothetical protein [Pelagicoccus sp. SDUM812005]MDQ8182230.1 hypothetical protein [Pelagicoccus sp. SDUM812005]